MRMFVRSAQWKKHIWLACFLCLLVVQPARAQMPLAAGKSLAFDASFGFEYTQMTVPGSGKTGMAGPKVTFTADLHPRLGVKVDVAYQRSEYLFGSGHHNDAFTYMGGPVFYALRKRYALVYAQALIGGARVAGVNNWQYGGYSLGFVNKPAWSFGLGVQHKITPATALRLQADYLHTSFFDVAAEVKGSYSLSGSLALVYEFGRGHSR